MKIYTGNDRAKEVVFNDRMGRVTFNTWRELLSFLLKFHHGMELPVEFTEEVPAIMRIDFGRMVADCGNCGGTAYIEPTDPFMFCTNCKNAKYGGKLRQVIIPVNLDAICDELLKREVNEPQGFEPTQAAAQAVPVITGLVRSWNPNETISDLIAQREAAQAAKDENGI